MAVAQIQATDLFGGEADFAPVSQRKALSRKQLAARHAAYMEKLHAVGDGYQLSKADLQTRLPHVSGRPMFEGLRPVGAGRTPLDELQAVLKSETITKALTPDSLAAIAASLEAQKAQIPDLGKDLTTSSPISTGLVVFDLEAPAKMLIPKPTPLRNRIPRRQGRGLSHRTKRITGFSGTGTGGVGVIRPGISDSTQTNFAASGSANNLFFNRGGKISYAGDDLVFPYIQFGVSDEVNWSAQYASQGYQDLRALSRQALLWASMLLEERVLGYGRGTGTGYAGTLAAPTSVSMTARAATGSEVGLSGITTNVYAYVVAELGDWGVSQTATVANVAASNGQVIDITYTLPAGATGAKVFLGTGAAQPANTAFRLYTFDGSATSPTPGGRSGYNKLTIQGALPTTTTQVTAFPLTKQGGGTVDLTSTDGGSADANEYDGIHAYATNASIAGYTKAINGLFSNTNPGVEYQTAFGAMYDAVKASPDRIMMNGQDRRQLSDTIKGSSNSNYGIRLMQDDVNGVTLGSIAASILNEVSPDSKEVQTEVWPWMPQGNSWVLSDTLPIPDTNVDTIFACYNVQDYMGIDWPVNQFTFDSSSYWFGLLFCHAPKWIGSVTGIQRN